MHFAVLIFSISTRFAFFCAAPISKFAGVKNVFVIFPHVFWNNFCKFAEHLHTFTKNLMQFCKRSEFRAVQKNANLVDLENAENAYFLAIVAVHTGENEPLKVRV